MVPDDLIPSYLKTEIDEETDKLIKEQLEIEERVMSIKLRIHQEGKEMKVLTFRKNETLKDIAGKIMTEFGIENVDLKDFRLRGYDSKLKAKLAVYN